MRRILPVLIGMLSIVAAACGGDTGDTPTSLPSTTVTTADSTQPTPTTAVSTTTSQPSTTTTTQSPVTTAPESTTSTLAGDPIDFGPAAGDVLMVIGVRYDDALNLRSGPGQDVVAQIPPTFANLLSLGNTRELPRSMWIEVDYSGTEGWVSLSYIGYEGETDDRTSFVVDALGETPVADTAVDLGALVAGVFASEEPESDIVQVTEVGSGDLAEVTYDVVGLGDDAVRGVRVHVFAEKTGAGFSLKSAEVTVICGRGVDGSGACV